MKPSQKAIAPTFVALIIAIVLAGGYVVIRKNLENQPIQKDEIRKKDEMAEWKTYRNPQ
ncbi:MAG: hypothetical protein G01um101472_55 [Parcubacteria group bacterium Gr01-1014_72]|nr:MAG: hypothetical protein G01um101472_55 [Parcubacteria group bacterium Gr01-1014_72]